MSTNKLLEKLQNFLNQDKHIRIKQMDSIKSILKKLKKQEKELKGQLTEEQDREEYECINRKVSIIREQRKKGIRALKKLRKD